MTADRCTACGRPAAQVKTLLSARSGADLVICDKCVRECERAIADAPTRIPGAAYACSYCSKPEDAVAVIIAIGAKRICDECVDAYRSQL
jgi:ATP-dependent protease Clp ATPase subunit